MKSGRELPVRVEQTGEDTTEDEDHEPSQEYLDGILEDVDRAIAKLRAKPPQN